MEIILAKDIPTQRSKWIHYELGDDANYVIIEIYSTEIRFAAGRPIRWERLGAQKAGKYQWFWDGRNQVGERVAAGHYYVTIRTEYGTATIQKRVGGPYGCVESLVRDGRSVVYAANECGIPFEDIDLDGCIAEIIRRERKSFSDALYICKASKGKAKKLVLPEECLEKLVMDGWDITVAAEECAMKLKEPDLNDCVASFIWQGQNYNDALRSCRSAKYGNGKDNGKPKEPKEKMPTWAWGAIAFGAMFLLMGRK